MESIVAYNSENEGLTNRAVYAGYLLLSLPVGFFGLCVLGSTLHSIWHSDTAYGAAFTVSTVLSALYLLRAAYRENRRTKLASRRRVYENELKNGMIDEVVISGLRDYNPIEDADGVLLGTKDGSFLVLTVGARKVQPAETVHLTLLPVNREVLAMKFVGERIDRCPSLSIHQIDLATTRVFGPLAVTEEEI